MEGVCPAGRVTVRSAGRWSSTRFGRWPALVAELAAAFLRLAVASAAHAARSPAMRIASAALAHRGGAALGFRSGSRRLGGFRGRLFDVFDVAEDHLLNVAILFFIEHRRDDRSCFRRFVVNLFLGWLFLDWRHDRGRRGLCVSSRLNRNGRMRRCVRHGVFGRIVTRLVVFVFGFSGERFRGDIGRFFRRRNLDGRLHTGFVLG